MQCVPFYSVIKALGKPTIDFMSLDIEGTELQVLKTIPFDQVDIRVSSPYGCHLSSILFDHGAFPKIQHIFLPAIPLCTIFKILLTL